jgi:hypothetical protein
MRTYGRRVGGAFAHETRGRRSLGNLGLATGLGNLVDSVNRRLDEEDPLHTDRIIEIIREEREKVPAFWLDSERVRNSLEHETSWMFSYLTADSIDRPVDSFQLRIALCHPSHGYTFAVYPANSGCLLLPADVVASAADALHQQLVEGLRPMDESQTLQESITHHVALSARVINGAADLSVGVSPNFQIGVHVVIGVSELWIPGANFSFNLRSINAGEPS